MAAMRARRGGRGSSQRGRASGPAHESMPRLARIKLSGGIGGEDVKVTGKSLALGLTGLVLFVGIAAASATWLGSSLFDAREAFARAADGAAASAGFAIAEVEIEGVAGARAEEVRALIVPEGRRSILSLEPEAVRARVQSLDWVAGARVRRLWPSTIIVEVERRREFALWEENGQVSVIDINGERLLAERVEDHPNLPRVVGAGAGPSAEPLLAALEGLPQVRARARRIVRIGDRRWNLELASGAVVALPEADAAGALARLEALQAAHALLDRPVATMDMRVPGRLSVRVRPELAGAVHPGLGRG